MAEESNAPSQTPIPKFVLGDKVRPRVYLRHKRNISQAGATFEHETRAQLERMDFTNVGPITMMAQPQPVQSRGDSKTSCLLFKGIKIERWMQPGLYECTSLELRYVNGTKETIAIPEDLKFEIVEDTPDTPEVQRVEWGGPLA